MQTLDPALYLRGGKKGWRGKKATERPCRRARPFSNHCDKFGYGTCTLTTVLAVMMLLLLPLPLVPVIVAV